MDNTEMPTRSNYPEREIDLLELWRVLWANKVIIIVIGTVFAVSSVFYALSKPDVYQATTLLSPASSKTGSAGLAGQFGGLASLAGINIGGNSSDRTGLALEVIYSRHFLETFIEKHKLLVPLMAATEWDKSTNKLTLNADVYDSTTQQWLINSDNGESFRPSLWQAVKQFREILVIDTDKESGMVTITIDFFSPKLATQWLAWLVDDINATMREKDNQEAKNSIEFLTAKLEQTKLADMQQVFYDLIEEQTKTLMLSEVSSEYVLKTVDPANAPEERSSPKRSVIVVIGTMLGGMLAIIIVLIRHFATKTTVATSTPVSR